MDVFKDIADIAKDWGFPAMMAMVLLYLQLKGMKELTEKISESLQGTNELVSLARTLSTDLKEQHTDIRGLRSDVRELFRALMFGRGIYNHALANQQGQAPTHSPYHEPLAPNPPL